MEYNRIHSLALGASRSNLAGPIGAVAGTFDVIRFRLFCCDLGPFNRRGSYIFVAARLVADLLALGSRFGIDLCKAMFWIAEPLGMDIALAASIDEAKPIQPDRKPSQLKQ